MKRRDCTSTSDDVVFLLQHCYLTLNALEDRQIHLVMQHECCQLEIGRLQGCQIRAHAFAIAVSAWGDAIFTNRLLALHFRNSLLAGCQQIDNPPDFAGGLIFMRSLFQPMQRRAASRPSSEPAGSAKTQRHSYLPCCDCAWCVPHLQQSCRPYRHRQYKEHRPCGTTNR